MCSNFTGFRLFSSGIISSNNCEAMPIWIRQTMKSSLIYSATEKKKEGKFQKTSCFTLLYIWKFFTQKTCKRLLDSLFSEIYFKKTRRRRRTGRTWAAKTSSKSVLLLGLARPTVSDMISFGSEVARLGQVDRGCFLDLFHGPFLFHGEIEPFFSSFFFLF